METRNAADPLASQRAGYDAVEAALAALVQRNGRSVLQRSGHVRRLLAEACPDASTEIALIIAAMSAEVPQRLRVARNDERLPALLRETAKHLQDQASLDAGLAAWAVATWARALSLPTAGLSAAKRTPPSPPRPPPPPASTIVRSRLAAQPAERVAPIAPPPVARPVPPPTVRPVAAPVSSPISSPVPPPTAMDAPSPPVDPDRAFANTDAAILLEPLFSDQDLARIGRSTERAASSQPEALVAPRRDALRRHSLGAALATAATIAVVAMAGYFARDVRGWFDRPAPASVTGVVVQVPAAPIPSAAPSRIDPVAGTVQPDVEPTPPVSPAAPVQSSTAVGAAPAVASPPQAGIAPANGSAAPPSVVDAADPPVTAPTPAMAEARKPDVIVPPPATAARKPSIERGIEACTGATCGTVVDAREVGPTGQVGPAVYEITVRLDNRQARSFAAMYRLQAGSRVRVIGDRLLPVGTAGR